jgi:hypothetical protein
MAKRIREPVITRIAVVDKGDNPKARILLFKNDKGGQNDNDNKKTIKKGDEYDMTIEEILAKLSQEEQDFIKADMDARKNEVEVVKTEKDTEIAELQTSLDEMKTKVGDLEKKIKEPESVKDKDADDKKDVLAKADPEIKKVFNGMQEKIEKIQNENIEKEKKVEELSKTIKKRDFVEKADTLKGLGEEADSLADVLMDLSEKAPESYAKIEKILETTNKKLEESDLFKTAGTDQGGVSGDVASEIKKKAAEVAQRDKITKEQAELKVLEEDPELYKRYKAEREQ